MKNLTPNQIALSASAILGLLVLFGQSFAFFYHLANGIRHLVWDAGYGFDKHVAQKSGWVAFIAALLVTIVFWKALFVATPYFFHQWTARMPTYLKQELQTGS